VQESFRHHGLLTIARMGPKALFVYAALDPDSPAWSSLQTIVFRSCPPAVAFSDEEVEQVAAQIDDTEDEALTDWVTRVEQDLPPWFRRQAIQVVLAATRLILNPVVLAPFEPFVHPSVDPASHDRKTARTILHAAFKAHLDTYLDLTYAELERKRRIYKHCQWAARYQLGNEEYGEIALTAKVTSQAVGQEVRNLLARIDLTPRPPASKGGRPPKIKPQS